MDQKRFWRLPRAIRLLSKKRSQTSCSLLWNIKRRSMPVTAKGASHVTHPHSHDRNSGWIPVPCDWVLYGGHRENAGKAGKTHGEEKGCQRTQSRLNMRYSDQAIKRSRITASTYSIAESHDR